VTVPASPRVDSYPCVLLCSPSDHDCNGCPGSCNIEDFTNQAQVRLCRSSSSPPPTPSCSFPCCSNTFYPRIACVQLGRHYSTLPLCAPSLYTSSALFHVQALTSTQQMGQVVLLPRECLRLPLLPSLLRSSGRLCVGMQVEQCRLAGLPDLNQTNPYVAQQLTQWIQNVVTTFGFDGLRVDTTPEVGGWHCQGVPGDGQTLRQLASSFPALSLSLPPPPLLPRPHPQYRPHAVLWCHS
jgi:hypothetical protein